MNLLPGEKWTNLLRNNAYPVPALLDVMMEIAEGLTPYHDRSKIHGRIQPELFQWKTEPFQVELGDPGLGDVEQQVYYQAPEQTGRLSLTPDQRSDLYSLGVVFYELLTGRRPFESDDYMEILHAHLAKEAPAVNRLNPAIPDGLSNLVAKLMAKGMEERYQSLAELLTDLRGLRGGMQKRADGSWEISEGSSKKNLPVKKQLTLAEIIREVELSRLKGAFEQVKSGQGHLVLVTGDAGIGKTSLVSKFALSAQQEGARFIHAKFNQYQQDNPNSVLIQAIEALLREVLRQNRLGIRAWRERFHTCLEGNGRILTDIFPSLEKIVGPQESVEDLPPQETQDRVQRAFQQLLSLLFPTTDSTIFFMDDVQWADVHSLHLLEYFVRWEGRHNSLLIFAYRNDEESIKPAFAGFLAKLLDRPTYPLSQIALHPFSQAQTEEYLSGILKRHDQPVRRLAHFCHEQSKGNPFFLSQLLQRLYEEGFVRYDPEQDSWQISLNHTFRLDEDVIEFMIQKIAQLPVFTVQVLQVASCMNNPFDLRTLAAICALQEEVVEASMQEASQEGLVVISEPGPCEAEGRYRFLHDKIQQATNTMLSEEAREEICYRLGRWYLEQEEPNHDGNNLYEATTYLNQARNRLTEDEVLQLARLNFQSGKQARQAAAYESALEYYRRGISLLGQQLWEEQVQDALDSHLETAQIAYLCGQYPVVEQYGREVIARGKSPWDKAKAYVILIESFFTQNQLEKAVKTGIEALELLGIHVSSSPSKLDLLRKHLEIQVIRRLKGVRSLKDLPEMKDEKHLIIMRICIGTGLAAYSSGSMTFAMMVFQLVLISYREGVAPATPAAFVAYGHFLCSYAGNKEQGYQIAKEAIELQDQMRSRSHACLAHMLFEIAVRHQREPLRHTLRAFPSDHQLGFEVGDLISAGHVMMQYFVHLYFAGRNLIEIRNQMEESMALLLKSGNTIAIRICQVYLQGYLNLLEARSEPWRLEGAVFSEDTLLPQFSKENDQPILLNFYLLKMILAYQEGQTTESYACLKMAEENLAGARGTFCIPVYYFYAVLIRLSKLKTGALRTRRRELRKIRSHLHQLKQYQRACPANIDNKIALIEAEQAWDKGLPEEQVFSHFDRSIRLAQGNGFLPEQALAYEAAAKYAQEQGKEVLTLVYAKEAIACYTAWGWRKKASLLEERYQGLFQAEKRQKQVAGKADDPEKMAPQGFDTNTIIRASQALSQERKLPDLLQKMIWLALQNSGANKAYLLLEEEGRYLLEAEGNAEKKTIMHYTTIEKKSREVIPTPILNYVVNTHEPVLLNSETEKSAFIGDVQDLHHFGGSLLCVPVESKRNMVGILYLQNELMAGAFNQKHLEVLKILTTQLAISIENARLYQTLENRVRERTAELQNNNNQLNSLNIQLEQANQAKSDFLARMSHEMRTPLQGILGMASLLQKNGTKEEQREQIQAVNDSAELLLEIINEILDLAKVEANRLETLAKPFALPRLIREMLPPFRVMAEKKNLSLVVEEMPETIHFLLGDPLRIRQILGNLLGNAIKFTEKGKVLLRYQTQSKTAQGDEETQILLTIQVQDTGIGIPDSHLESIFEPFTQVDGGSARKYGGTGLGLAITRKILHLLNGTIQVESTLGIGSTFTCCLPLYLASEPPLKDSFETERVTDSLSQLSLRVLVAEDDEISGKYLCSLLRYLGGIPTLTLNGQEALDHIREEDYDCVILDKNMPVLDGFTTIRFIREAEEGSGRHLPIIVLTAAALRHEGSQSLEEGADYYLSKPLREHQLRAILHGLGESGHASPKPPQEKKASALPSSGLVDRPIFWEEASLFGEEVFVENIQHFLTEYRQRLTALEEAIQLKDREETRKVAHRFASTLSALHASSLTTLARQLEQATDVEDGDESHRHFLAFKQQITSLAGELEELKEDLENILALNKKIYRNNM